MIQRVDIHKRSAGAAATLTTNWLIATAVAALVGAFSPRAHSIELVQNGGFETGTFSGWTTVPSEANIDPLIFGVDGAGPKNGQYSAYFGNVNQVYDSISQALATTAGEHYTVSLYLDGELSQGAPASFIGSFGGVAFLSVSDQQPDFDFRPFVFDVVATGSSTVLTFKGYNTNSFYTLDDISVAVTVPESPVWVLMVMAAVAGVGAKRFSARRG